MAKFLKIQVRDLKACLAVKNIEIEGLKKQREFNRPKKHGVRSLQEDMEKVQIEDLTR